MLQALLDNPFILIILIGIVSSVFKKRKETNQGTRKKGNIRSKTSKIEEGKIPDWKTSRTDVLIEQRKTNNVQYDYNAKKELVDKKFKGLKDEYSFVSNKNELPKEKNQLVIDNKNMADAIIWSEVLGPPRSKKMHMNLRVKRYGR